MEFGKILVFIVMLVEHWLGICVFFPEVIDKRYDTKKRWCMIVSVSVISILYAYNGMLAWISTSMNLFFPIMVGVLFLVVKKDCALLALLWEMTYLLFTCMMKLSVLLCEGMINEKNIIEVNRYGEPIWVILTELLCIVFLFILILYRKHHKFFVRDLCRRVWPLLLVVDWIENEIISFIMNKSVQEIQKPYLLVNLGFIVVIILCMFVTLTLSVIWKIKAEKDLLLLNQKLQKDYHIQLQQRYDEMAKRSHDIQHERNFLYQCLIEENYEKARLFLQEKNENPPVSVDVWTGYKYIDFLISLKKKTMDENKIVFQLYSDYVSIPISEGDLVIILGNLLDNAIEAAVKCNLDRRWISMDIIKRGCTFQVRIKNANNTLPKKSMGKFSTTKIDAFAHGYGLKNVEEIVEKENGTIKFYYTQTSFEVLIVFLDKI